MFIVYVYIHIYYIQLNNTIILFVGFVQTDVTFIIFLLIFLKQSLERQKPIIRETLT